MPRPAYSYLSLVDTPTGTGITNAYGRTKYMIEEVLKDFKRAKDMALEKEDKGQDPWYVFNPKQ